MIENLGNSKSSKKNEEETDISHVSQPHEEPLVSEPQQSASPQHKEKEPLKEPWQYNEDLKEKLAIVSSEFTPPSLKKEEEKKPSDISIKPVETELQKGGEKILATGASGHLFDKKKFVHHPASLFILLGVVGFGLAALLFSVLLKSSSKKTVPKPKGEPSVVEIAIPVDVLGKDQGKAIEGTQEQKEDSARGVRPMPSINLSGIIFDEQKGGLALINGKIVKEGYTIDGIKLERVYSDKVEMSFEGKKFILRSR